MMRRSFVIAAGAELFSRLAPGGKDVSINIADYRTLVEVNPKLLGHKSIRFRLFGEQTSRLDALLRIKHDVPVPVMLTTFNGVFSRRKITKNT